MFRSLYICGCMECTSQSLLQSRCRLIPGHLLSAYKANAESRSMSSPINSGSGKREAHCFTASTCLVRIREG